jgi:hypothetical protein
MEIKKIKKVSTEFQILKFSNDCLFCFNDMVGLMFGWNEYDFVGLLKEREENKVNVKKVEMTINEHEKEQKDLEITNLKDEVSRLTAVQSSSRTDANGCSLPSLPPLPPPSRDAMLIVPLPTVPVVDKDGKETAVVIATHAWGSQSDSYENHRRVGKIYGELKSRYNMKMWFDQDYIQGSIVDEIVHGLAHTKCMVVFLTKQYQTKIGDNKEGKMCKLEFDRGLMRFGHDRLIPVIMEEEMLNPSNWSENVGLHCLELPRIIDFTGLPTMTDTNNDRRGIYVWLSVFVPTLIVFFITF